MAAATTWGAGDYPRMARALLPAAVAAVEVAQVQPGDLVVDVATGTGNAALLAAARGARVVGVDTEPALLRLAAQRAQEEEHDVAWVRGDAQALPVPSRSADVVLSVFGTMYAPDHEAAAAELGRTAGPGARVVLASWVPGSVLPAAGQVFGAFLPPPPPSSGPPSRWGEPEALTPLLGRAGLTVTAAAHRELVLDLPDVPSAASLLLETAGHVVSERDRLVDEGRWDDLREALEGLVADRADTVAGRVRLTLQYLLAQASPA